MGLEPENRIFSAMDIINSPVKKYNSKLVIFNQTNLTIELYETENSTNFTYEVDLERCCTGSQLVDWIFQLARKSWTTPNHIYDFIKVFEDICQELFEDTAQAIICPFGKTVTIDWKNKTSI